jgi:hypothetical protein
MISEISESQEAILTTDARILGVTRWEGGRWANAKREAACTIGTQGIRGARPSTTQSGQRPFKGSSVDPHPTTLACLPRGEDESSGGAGEQTLSRFDSFVFRVIVFAISGTFSVSGVKSLSHFWHTLCCARLQYRACQYDFQSAHPPVFSVL